MNRSHIHETTCITGELYLHNVAGALVVQRMDEGNTRERVRFVGSTKLWCYAANQPGNLSSQILKRIKYTHPNPWLLHFMLTVK